MINLAIFIHNSIEFDEFNLKDRHIYVTRKFHVFSSYYPKISHLWTDAKLVLNNPIACVYEVG